MAIRANYWQDIPDPSVVNKLYCSMLREYQELLDTLHSKTVVQEKATGGLAGSSLELVLDMAGHGTNGWTQGQREEEGGGDSGEERDTWTEITLTRVTGGEHLPNITIIRIWD